MFNRRYPEYSWPSRWAIVYFYTVLILVAIILLHYEFKQGSDNWIGTIVGVILGGLAFGLFCLYRTYYNFGFGSSSVSVANSKSESSSDAVANANNSSSNSLNAPVSVTVNLPPEAMPRRDEYRNEGYNSYREDQMRQRPPPYNPGYAPPY